MAVRYGKSSTVAALSTIVLGVGTAPYLSLQIRSIMDSLAVSTDASTSSTTLDVTVRYSLIALLIVFTIAYGFRRLGLTERHPGMVASLAFDGIVKLVAFGAAGVFATWIIFDGPGDVLTAMSERLAGKPFAGRMNASQLVDWVVSLMLSMSAFVLLPRQFHLWVVEAPSVEHTRTATWSSVLYLILINVFVVPVALAGIQATHGMSPDLYVLGIAEARGAKLLSLAILVGGFSAAMGMIVLSTMTVSTMVTNYVIIPVAQKTVARFALRRVLLIRWVVAGFVILFAYALERTIGHSSALVATGMVSFAAIFQFAPLVLGGLLWRNGNRTGAIAGLAGGFGVWSYTLLLPLIAKGGWIPTEFLQHGPWGMAFLRPEHLFGLDGLSPLSHGVFWSLLVNCSSYVIGSAMGRMSPEDQQVAEQFCSDDSEDAIPRRTGSIGDSIVRQV